MGINTTVIPSQGLAIGSIPDNITLELNAGGSAVEIKDRVQNDIADALVGVVLATSTAGFTPTQAKADYFSAAAGRESTIDTTAGAGNTTAGFNTNKYQVTFSGAATPTETAANNGGTGGTSTKTGIKITVGSTPLTLTNVARKSGCNAVGAHLCDASHGEIAYAAFSGDNATFSNVLAAGTSYWIQFGDSTYSGSFTDKAQAGTFPTVSTYITWVKGYEGTTEYDTFYNINSLTFSIATVTSGTLKSAALTALNGTITKLRMHAYNVVLGTGNTPITFDVDYNGDGSYDLTAQALDTWITAAATLSGAKVRFNFAKGAGADGTVTSLQGYCLMVD